MDELEVIAEESKATHQEIKEYIMEHNRLKISSLYIVQVKQKCGIIKRKNYNKPKFEDSKQTQCPKKEAVIMNVLIYFQMI